MTRALVAVGILLAFPAVAVGQQVDAQPGDSVIPGIGVRGSLQRPSLQLRVPPQLAAPWLGGPRVPPALVGLAWQQRLEKAIDSAQAARTHGNALLDIYGIDIAGADSAEQALREKGVFGLSRKAVDLTLDGTVRLEIRADRLKNLRCTSASILDPNSGCRGEINGPRIENQLNIRSGGIIGQRLRVNVDWDTQRDFTNANNIQVYYEGLEDEFVRRIEVGSVQFRPPPSRFLTASIPTNNFGINAVFQYGALEFQTLAATQSGSSVADRVYTIGQTTSQPIDRAQRELDFEYGRFFWLLDPRTLPNYPAIDALTLDALQLPGNVRPAQVRVYRYRVPQTSGGVDPNLGGIPACSRQGPDGRNFGPVSWQLLVLGADYYLDPSGLWIAFTQKIDQRADYIAVSYVTQAGTQVGSFPSAPNPSAGPTCNTVDSLRMVAEPLVGTDQPSFFNEMRQFYRVAGQDLDVSSLQLNISLNRSERPLPPSNFATYLSALGLAVPTDAEVVDRVNRLFPRVRDPGASDIIREAFLVFPNATPFADATRLSQPSERIDSLYRTPIYLLFTQGPPSRYQLRLRYNSTGAGDRSTLSLNALQLKETSEKLYLGGRLLERGVDYTIDYATGVVTFLNPDVLFGTGVVQVTARFEERGLFAVAPTSIFGLSGRYDLGRYGAVNVMGLYQREQSAFSRPALGFEASANLVAGANTQLRFQPDFLSRFFSSLTNGQVSTPAFLEVNAELGFTKPDPNRSGEAYLDEFEEDAGLPVTLRDALWEFGSLPQSTAGIDPSVGLGGAFDPDDAVQLIWQNLVPNGSGGVVEFFPQDIDPNIETTGRSRTPETVMFLTLHADTAGGVVQQNNASRWSQPERPGRPRWRSMQTSVSTTGLDFSRATFLEFWLYEEGTRPADNAGVNLIFDIGSVDEDAIALAPTTLAANPDTVYTGRQYVGLGVLNTERKPNGIFNADIDDIGILGDLPDLVTDLGQPLPAFPLCQVILGTAVQVFPWGDLSARCTRGNGVLNTEDLDGDNTLNARGGNDNVSRYVVNLADSTYFVRRGVTDPGTGSGWRLFRVPLRDVVATIGTPNIRLVQHLRVTVAAPDQGGPDQVARFALARLRFVGAPWLARAASPIAGISGSTGEPTGEVLLSIISTLDSTDLGYVSPPGVVAQLQRRDQIGASDLGVQINEKSLRVIARQLSQNTRAEGYVRFPAGAQRFLGYRELRVWMRGARNMPGWDNGDMQGYIKVESDDNNFYMYKTPLHAMGGQEAWTPEVVVDMDTWRSLRAQLESQIQQGAPPFGADVCGGDPAAYVACDGPYLVHILNPFANPPNLAAVQGLSTGFIRVASGVSDTAEMWVDDIRLAAPVSTVGAAYALDARLAAGDVFNASVLVSSVNGQFRQLGDQPTFRTTGGLQAAANVRVDRFLNPNLGLLIPINFSLGRTTVDPQLLTNSDIEGDALPGLRKPEATAITAGILVRRSVRSPDVLMRTLVDPLSLSASFTRGRAQSELSRTNADAYNVLLSYQLVTARKGKPLNLGFVDNLPGFIRNSDFGRGLATANYVLAPTNIRLQSGLARDQSYFYTYLSPVSRTADDLVVPTLALQHLWRNSASATWQPLGMLLLGADYTTVRDLRDYGDTTELGRLATAERSTLLGVDVGVERDRNISTLFAISPRIASWLRARFSSTSSFVLARQLNSRQPVQVDGDTAGAFILPQTYNNSRSNEIAVGVDYGRGIRQIVGDSSDIGAMIRRFRAFDVSYRVVNSSTYDLATFEPSPSYMLALGSLETLMHQDGQTALGAARTATTQFGTGIEFPFGLTATVNYANSLTDRFQRIGGTQRPTSIRTKEWPSGALRFNRPFGTGPISLLALGTTLRKRSSSTTQAVTDVGSGAPSVISNESRNFIPELAVTLRSGVAFAGTWNFLKQQSIANGNQTLLDQADLNGTLSYAFALPRSISRTGKVARSSLSMTVSKATQCLQRQNQAACEVISDTRRQEYRGSVDTDVVSSLTAGLQLGYTINDFRHLDRKNSQIFLVASLTLSLFAGDFR